MDLQGCSQWNPRGSTSGNLGIGTSGLPIRDLFGEPTGLVSNKRDAPVTRKRRESLLSPFDTFSLFCKGFRQHALRVKTLCFGREPLGCERNPQGSSRCPRLSVQNSQSLKLPPLEKLPARFLSHPEMEYRTGRSCPVEPIEEAVVPRTGLASLFQALMYRDDLSLTCESRGH